MHGSSRSERAAPRASARQRARSVAGEGRRRDRAGAAGNGVAGRIDFPKDEVADRASVRTGHAGERDLAGGGLIELGRALTRDDIGDQVHTQAAGVEPGVGASDRERPGLEAPVNTPALATSLKKKTSRGGPGSSVIEIVGLPAALLPTVPVTEPSAG
jgi:hypothetical protein